MSSLHYCIWGLCESWEYCCGDNACCKETNFDSLFLTITILGTLVAVALCCVGFYCSSRRICAKFLKRYFKISYTLMSTQRDIKLGSTINQESMTNDCIVKVETTKVSL
ncbi:uncharacterized protein LOC143143774 isoform X3 [Ptiloglossa arizonensis]|uniref:uncharacterized protein LOC143143774 isoform X2 n=1 Tax=Ptiloglossa arizonensis TaxID=3350558 RepID=UPI003F9EF800